MVDVSAKAPTRRRAVATTELRMKAATARLLAGSGLPKGDALAAARVAGIMAAKRTPDLIPLCHTVPLTSVEIDFSWDKLSSDAIGEGSEAILQITAVAETIDRTGVEMEALVAVSVAALTIYDMCKAVDREMRIERTQLLEKTGGRSGRFRRQAEEAKP